MRLIKGAGSAIRKLNQAGILTILVTNQSGPARGYYDEAWIGQLHKRLVELLDKENARLDAIYYCPHLKEGTVPEYSIDCDCRKPKTGMFEKAQRDWGIDLSASFMLGDKATDVEAGQNANCKTILLRTGYGQRVLNGEYQYVPSPDFIEDDIVDAINRIFNIT